MLFFIGEFMMYFGGKFRISKQIATLINSYNPTTYVEPFCGSCNVAIKIDCENKILNDKHPYLIEMWKALQNGWIPPTECSEEMYKYYKENKDINKPMSGFIGFACSFAGKWFGGYARNKVRRNYCMVGHNSVLKKIPYIKDAKFTCCDFSELNFKDTLIYCDPPYKNTTPYNKALLGKFPDDEFVEWVKQQSKHNIVLVSEYKHNVPDGANILLEINSKTAIRDKNNDLIPTIETVYTFKEDL